ncbi:tRNA specific adenosine deaminase [Weissella viridescens]|uniref:tRNA-specific adenosine deaminase n=1 Tax=Weissella viridescens TaxID=1629 RepID=A0A0R2H0D7_WEIVI|nr:tRNA adenosine(34) deaminase TadA [Weissella viridescens]KRN46419.1 tRNA-adenosine deaminase [Weissella viridescens]GEA94794.1 tRNA-specific adenosine deaminase [Weissella viridescens]SOB42966.1 tRNA specific adenosine deaminase [Weissella viridescens]SUP52571.1 tRNA-specific adenosine deaminase [Weissella viridescens]
MSTDLSPAQIDYFMGQALYEAKKAGALGEVPIGAVVVIDGQIVSRGFNLRERMQDATQHAELMAISEANRFEHSWRLPEAQLFVTLEPCLMCAGLIQQTRITDVYYGAADPKGGAVDSLYNVLGDARLNHQVNVVAGVREAECSALLKAFFKAVRKKRKAEKRARKEAENKLVK